MANPESRRTETMVGLFVLLGLAVISVLVFAIAEKQHLFERHFKVTALFSRVGGLKVGSPVRLAGLEVGSVEALDFTPGGRVEGVLAIQARFAEQIRGDSVATISSVGVLGDKSVEISIGSMTTAPLTDGAEMQTKDPVDVAELIDQIAPMAVKVDEILTYLSKITGEFSTEDLQVSKTMTHAHNIMQKVDDGTGALGKAINDPALYDKAVRLADAVSDAAGALDQTMSRIDTASQEFPALIASTRKAMEDVSAISGSVRESLSRFPKIVEHVDEIATNIQIASEDLPAIAASVRNATRGADDVVEAAKRSWLIRRNLPKPAASEERILLDGAAALERGARP
jgi:ABC-type transporter Mla subunit MlaD